MDKEFTYLAVIIEYPDEVMLFLPDFMKPELLGTYAISHDDDAEHEARLLLHTMVDEVVTELGRRLPNPIAIDQLDINLCLENYDALMEERNTPGKITILPIELKEIEKL